MRALETYKREHTLHLFIMIKRLRNSYFSTATKLYIKLLCCQFCFVVMMVVRVFCFRSNIQDNYYASHEYKLLSTCWKIISEIVLKMQTLYPILQKIYMIRIRVGKNLVRCRIFVYISLEKDCYVLNGHSYNIP